MEDDDELGSVAGAATGEKKRRLSVDQVRALERSFEVENKLEPERKARLAEELGLQPRQVAVWFQNRRARWKTKQLERDYAALKATYDALRLDFDALYRDKAALLAQIEELKAKFAGEESLSFSSVKEEPLAAPAASSEEEPPPALIFKDGSSDSDSSAVLNSPRQGTSSSQATAPAALGSSTSSVPTSTPLLLNSLDQHQHVLKMETTAAEDEEFLGREEVFSSLFSDEQPPTLNWYYSEHWN
ncbi:hypothetical protein Cni_G28749 [Canna indica]|uniref:Homeobox-leucine zipper protein n=1 Tax=Canna indica TaxID=4628 RepID=A0AAQ3L315_9LILI|nr:hypothetical protein Cni_G28749 [Canna indica]